MRNDVLRLLRVFFSYIIHMVLILLYIELDDVSLALTFIYLIYNIMHENNTICTFISCFFAVFPTRVIICHKGVVLKRRLLRITCNVHTVRDLQS